MGKGKQSGKGFAKENKRQPQKGKIQRGGDFIQRRILQQRQRRKGRAVKGGGKRSKIKDYGGKKAS